MSAPNTPEKKEQKTGLLKKYLDNTFGDEGLRTDVKITLTNETLVKIVVTVIAAAVLGTAASMFTHRIINRLLPTP